MAISHVVVLTGALLILLCLPCLLMAFAPDQVAVRRAEPRGTGRQLRRLDRSLHRAPCMDRIRAAQEQLPPIEQIAAELRRLNRQRRGGLAHMSEKWLAAVLTAYDAWLWAACRRLDVTESLSRLEGDERHVERVRVESELEAAGLVFRPR